MKLKFEKLVVAVLVTVITTFGAVSSQAQKPKRLDNAPRTSAPAYPFEGGEELIYVAEFSRLLLKKMDVADFRFTAARQELEPNATDSLPATTRVAPYWLKFTGDISSKGFFTRLFNITFHQTVESIVEPSSFTVQKSKRIDEQGKRVRISETTYDRGKIFWIERDPNNASKVPRTTTTSFTGQIQDLLSAVYFLRTQQLEVGKRFEVTLSDSGRVYKVPMHVFEKKRLKTVLGRVEALRIDPQLYGPNGILGGKGQFSIWITNDSRRIPVSARSKTDLGTFDITLRKIRKPTPQSANGSPTVKDRTS